MRRDEMDVGEFRVASEFFQNPAQNFVDARGEKFRVDLLAHRNFAVSII